MSQEARRLEKLRSDLDKRQKKLDKELAQLRKEKQDLKSERSQLETEKRQLKNQSAKLKQDSKRLNQPKSPRSGNTSGNSAALKLKKVEDELSELKQRYEKRSAEWRQQKSTIDQLRAENKQMQRQLKSSQQNKNVNRSNPQSRPTNDPRIRRLEREIRAYKKKIRELLKRLRGRSRYYGKQINNFRTNQSKWIKKQRDTLRDKKIVMKYIPIGGARQVKIYRNGKRRVGVVDKDGDEAIIENIDVLAAADDTALEELLQELQQEGPLDLDIDDDDDLDETTLDELKDDDIDETLADVDRSVSDDDDDAGGNQDEKTKDDVSPLENTSSSSGKRLSEDFQVGDEVLLSKDREGIIRYIGNVEFAKGIQYGIELKNGAVGKHSGTVNGKQYFECDSKRGVFVTRDKIRRTMGTKDKNASWRLSRRDSLQTRGKLDPLLKGNVNAIFEELTQRSEDLGKLFEIMTQPNSAARDVTIRELNNNIKSRQADAFDKLVEAGIDKSNLESMETAWLSAINKVTNMRAASIQYLWAFSQSLLDELSHRVRDIEALQDLQFGSDEQLPASPKTKNSQTVRTMDEIAARHVNCLSVLQEQMDLSEGALEVDAKNLQRQLQQNNTGWISVMSLCKRNNDELDRIFAEYGSRVSLLNTIITDWRGYIWTEQGDTESAMTSAPASRRSSYLTPNSALQDGTATNQNQSQNQNQNQNQNSDSDTNQNQNDESDSTNKNLNSASDVDVDSSNDD